MLIFLRMAFLNVLRSPRRSAINLLAIAVGMAGMIFLWGFIGSVIEGVRSNVITYITGHVQVRPADFDDNLSPGRAVRGIEALDRFLSADPHVAGFSPRVRAEGLIQSSLSSQNIMINGILPDSMSGVLQLKQMMKSGSFISPEDPRGILIGDRLADQLQAGLGDKVVLTAQDRKGSLAGMPLYVSGIFHSMSSAMNERVVFVNLGASQELLGMGSDVSEMIIRLDDRKLVPDMIKALKPVIRPDEELVSWENVIPGIRQFVEWYTAVTRVILVAVTLVISIGIMNTVLMSVLERTREFGILLALGTRPRLLTHLVFAETAILSLVGISLGIACGLATVRYYGVRGIALTSMTEALEANFMNKVVHPSIAPDKIFESACLILAVTFLAVIYPAVRSARLSPIKAIYHI